MFDHHYTKSLNREEFFGFAECFTFLLPSQMMTEILGRDVQSDRIKTKISIDVSHKNVESQQNQW